MRHNFTQKTRSEAIKRAGDGDPDKARCEAVGEVYGLPAGQRCNAPLAGKRVEVDHYPVPATDEGSDVLSNAVVCCADCHSFKTRTYDVPMQAKGKRMSDRHLGIRQPSKWQSAGFPKAESQNSATRKTKKWGLLK